MSPPTATASMRPSDPRFVNFADTFDFLFDSTMAGGTSLFNLELTSGYEVAHEAVAYVAVRADVILQYERTINELRRDLLRYKTMLSQLLGPRDLAEELRGQRPTIPMDAASIRVLSSIASARIPSSATFSDFDEGEL